MLNTRPRMPKGASSMTQRTAVEMALDTSCSTVLVESLARPRRARPNTTAQVRMPT